MNGAHDVSDLRSDRDCADVGTRSSCHLMTMTTTSPDGATDRWGRRLGRWERRTEWPLTAAAALFLAAYAWPILIPHLSAGWKDVCRAVVLVAWIAFALDYTVRIVLAHDRARYVLRHLLDLAVIALPVLRPLRLLRLVLLLRVLNRGATNELRGRITVYVSGATILLLLTASLAELDAERGHAGANITSFGDALWWSATTITTVGYGDRYPVTTEGRWVAAGLMIGGVALLGIVTASIASWLIERVRETEQQAQAATREDVRILTSEINELRRQLSAVADHLAGADHASQAATPTQPAQ